MLASDIIPNAHTISTSTRGSPLASGRVLHSLAFKLAVCTDAYVATALLNMYARAGDASSAQRLFDAMPSPHVVSVTAMLNSYAKLGDLDKARELFDEMLIRDTVCWNAMIHGYTQYGMPNEALQLFRRMLKSDTRPDEITVVSVRQRLRRLARTHPGDGCILMSRATGGSR